MKWKFAVALATLTLGAFGSEPTPVPTESAGPCMPDLPAYGAPWTILAPGALRVAGYAL